MTPALAWEVAVPVPSLAPIDIRGWEAVSNVIDETVPRWACGSAALGGPTSGTLHAIGNLIIPAGKTVSNIFMFTQAAAVGLTNFWVCIFDLLTNTIQAVSTDLFVTYGATGLAAGLSPALPVSPYKPSKDTQVYAGIMQAGTTPNTFRGVGGLSGMVSIAPQLGGDSTVFGAVGPPAVGTTVLAPAGATTSEWWMALT